MKPDGECALCEEVKRLNDFSFDIRKQALNQLAHLANEGRIRPKAQSDAVNLHYHTFFSFNADWWSPSRIVWEAWLHGLRVVGTVDFDVLDARQEVLCAGEILGLRTLAGIESRVFVPSLAHRDINSPGEPGIAYFQGEAMYKEPQPGSEAFATLARLKRIARERNEGMMARVNAYLSPVELDYEKDVLTLVPAGNATERHLLAAYDAKARRITKTENQLVEFWSQKMGLDHSLIAGMIDKPAELHNTIRSRLMKKGGVGYVEAASDEFPALKEMVAMIRGCDGLPTYAWLDGTSAGEEDPRQLLGAMVGEGVVMLNIIPDRNWNIADVEEKAIKVKNLNKVVEVADSLDLPIIVGTEMNKTGLPFVDDFAAPEMRPHHNTFLTGAYFAYGCSALGLYAGLSYLSAPIEAAFGSSRRQRNAFFSEMGSLPLYQQKYRDTMARKRDVWEPAELSVALKAL